MSRNFIACELGEEQGRVVVGTLHQDRLSLSITRRFQNVPILEGDSIQWDAAQLYQDLIVGLRDVGAQDEAIESLSCTGWPLDYLLFHADASLIPPTFHHADPRTVAGRDKLLATIPAGQLYAETRGLNLTNSTLFQLAVEKSKRLKRADHLLPIADGFNFLLSGVAAVEESTASATQLYSPAAGTWSEFLINTLRLPPKLLPTVIPAGTKLKPLRPEIGTATGLESPQVIASCSHELAATIMGLPVEPDESWAFLRLGDHALIGAEHAEPACPEHSRDAGFSQLASHGARTLLHKTIVGLRVLAECQRHWAGTDSGLEESVITHLAANAPPLESFINFSDPRFADPGEMPLKIRGYCRETNQPEPRKPGPITRCVLESLALHFHAALQQLSALTGREFTRLILLGDTRNTLLNHFTANALQLPVTIASPDATVIGNIVVQALATGHIESLAEARRLIRQSIKTTTVMPYTASWASAHERFAGLIVPCPSGLPA